MTLPTKALAIAPLLFALIYANVARAQDGRRIYVNAGCQVCHGGQGEGGVGPEFVGDPLLALDNYVVARILIGGGAMEGFDGRLSDAEIAAVASYIRQTWGAQSPVSLQQVAAARAALAPKH